MITSQALYSDNAGTIPWSHSVITDGTLTDEHGVVHDALKVAM